MGNRQGRRLQQAVPRKVWKRTGKIFSLLEVLSIQEREDVPLSQVFRRLRDNLVTPEKDDFMRDEDPEVHDMLCRVFAEDDAPMLDIDGLEAITNDTLHEGVLERMDNGRVFVEEDAPVLDIDGLEVVTNVTNDTLHEGVLERLDSGGVQD